MSKFGTFFRGMRAKAGLSLREFCIENGFDPGNISRLERGLVPPPESREKLDQYSRALRLKKGSDDCYLFYDLAAAERGRIPDDVMKDESLSTVCPSYSAHCVASG